MEEMATMGIISILPAVIAIVLSFVTKNTVIALATACVVGTLCAGQGIFGFPTLLKESMGTPDFAWIVLLNSLIGVIVAYFQKTGAIQGFTEIMKSKNLSRKKVQFYAWLLGVVAFFSDSFAPLFVGTTMRNVSDSAKVSREKLAYIGDSSAAPVSILVPFTSWATYLASLSVGLGSIATQEQATDLLVRAIPFNFYAICSVLMVLLIATGVVKDFGPMKKAEERAWKEGKVIRDGGIPLVGKELTEMQPYEGLKPRIFLNFLLPILMIVVFALGTYIVMDSAKTMEAFLFVVIFLSISLIIQGIPYQEVMDTLIQGIKGALPALVLLALAYSVNGLSKQMGTANYIISATEGFLTPHLLPLIIFIIAAIMAFSTGSSWGTFAICMPIALPLAFQFTGGEVTTLVVASFAAVAGGGVFGDHCSPLSDTTVLASTGAASDHIDHVKTQLPYALTCAVISAVFYLIIGFFFV